ncbi:MAG: polysaccharide biosynthesis/export family protein [Phormidesmis sp.]
MRSPRQNQSLTALTALALTSAVLSHLCLSTDAIAQSQPDLTPLPSSPIPQSPTTSTPPLLAPALPFNTNDPLKPGDVLSITVLGFENLSGQQQVSSNGTVQLPLGGPIFVGGYTPLEAMSAIKTSLQPYVRRPEVSVALLSASPIRISVSGEVLQPGPRLILPINQPDDEPRRPPTLSTALMESGGITPSADLRNIVIRRPVPTRIEGQPATYGEFRVDLWQAVSSGDLQADPRIFDGDEIVVPTATAVDLDQRTLLSSTVAPSQITVQVAGEVNRPGQLVVSPLIGVSGAVAAAGGPTEDADKKDVVLLRMMPDGRIEQLSYTFGEASEPLIEGDVVFVEPSGRGNVGNVFDFLGRILNPFGTLLRLFY